MKSLSEKEVRDRILTGHKDWSFEGKSISRVLKFKDFVTAFSFMTSVAIVAEKLDHHPDWSNVYNTVTIRLNTHDANGITALDFDLAREIDNLYMKFS